MKWGDLGWGNLGEILEGSGNGENEGHGVHESRSQKSYIGERKMVDRFFRVRTGDDVATVDWFAFLLCLFVGLSVDLGGRGEES